MDNRILVAPMMDWTDRHCRYFMRLLSPSARLYTEMVTAAAIVHGDHEHLLRYNAAEHPIALQLGGSDAGWMATAALAAANYGYDEINVNVGCPSDRVQSGQFGACLMASPDIVVRCYKAMRAVVAIPVTIKTRIGIDAHDSYDFLRRFVDPLIDAGCRTFIVHARIALLDGLSPKQNRSVPPLDYERVYRLKSDYPDLQVVLNGGVRTLAQVDEVLPHVDGVMIGRQAYQQPYFLAELEQHLHPEWPMPGRRAVVEQMLPYIKSELAAGERLSRITRHMSGLFAEQPGARAWRRTLAENAYREGAGIEVVIAALDTMSMAA
ncbi:MAG: tRNA dihydrouridine(20/20a) synthase DusA [Gammaproteobacteria bacterium]|nr:tRNA dihydrouridine(20/20a) synthase DusA [Gammaproteobacteria bacterium]MDH5321609.1 tRNA dihydrouridine(20/20a) synthase DusA [Gammaproteobacteria bacterium]